MDGWMDVIEATEVIVISMRDFPSAKVGCSRDGVTPPVVGSRAVVRTLFDAYHFLFRGFPARHPPPTLLHRLYILWGKEGSEYIRSTQCPRGWRRMSLYKVPLIDI